MKVKTGQQLVVVEGQLEGNLEDQDDHKSSDEDFVEVKGSTMEIAYSGRTSNVCGQSSRGIRGGRPMKKKGGRPATKIVKGCVAASQVHNGP